MLLRYVKFLTCTYNIYTGIFYMMEEVIFIGNPYFVQVYKLVKCEFWEGGWIPQKGSLGVYSIIRIWKVDYFIFWLESKIGCRPMKKAVGDCTQTWLKGIPVYKIKRVFNFSFFLVQNHSGGSFTHELKVRGNNGNTQQIFQWGVVIGDYPDLNT